MEWTEKEWYGSAEENASYGGFRLECLEKVSSGVVEWSQWADDGYGHFSTE
jgi:hypothetical protein